MKDKKVKNTFKNDNDLIDQLIKLSSRISRPTIQLPYDNERCLISTNLILELRMLLKEIKKNKEE